MDRAGYALLALTGGGLIAAQAPINARLRTVLHAPVSVFRVSTRIG